MNLHDFSPGLPFVPSHSSDLRVGSVVNAISPTNRLVAGVVSNVDGGVDVVETTPAGLDSPSKGFKCSLEKIITCMQ